jgi:hypothetical protein
MKTKFNKLLPIVGIACLGLTQLSADYNTNSQATPPTQMAVPPSPTPGEAGPNVFISADYTLWTAREAGLAIATSNCYTTPTSTATQGKVYYPENKLRSGFKVDLGVYLPHDNWDIKAEYTWFYNNSNSLHNANFTAGTAVATFSVDPDASYQTFLNSAQSSWNNWFNRIDLTMGRSFFAGHYLAIRPFMGLLGAWDNQKLNIIYQDTFNQNYYLNNSQKWWGVGAYGGLNATFTFVSDSSNQWSLFLDSGAALPWSKFRGSQSVATTATGSSKSIWFTNTFYNVCPMLETSLGIRWETWWSDGSWMFLLQAAWEEQVWFNHNNFLVAGSSAVGNGNGALSLNGLTVRAAIAF